MGVLQPSNSGHAVPLVNISGIPLEEAWRPSRFNARTDAPNGDLIVYNSYTGAFSIFPVAMRNTVEELLHKAGFNARSEGLTKYLFDSGFIVKKHVDELDRVRMRHGQETHRRDRLELILLSSEECNFRCIYCYESFARGTMEPWVRDALKRMVVNRLPRLRSLSVGYFGGEPLLGYEAIQDLAPFFLRKTAREDIQFDSGMTTNGYLLTPDRFEQLVRWKVTRYQISLDGAPQDHDAHRPLKAGGGTFATIIENLTNIKKSSHSFFITIRVNFDKTNIPRMEEFLELISPFKADKRFQLRFYSVGAWGGPNDDSLSTCGVDSEFERQRMDVMASRAGFSAESRMPYIQGSNVCYAARPYNLIIGADGKIMKCTVALDTQDYNIVGKLSPDGHAEIDIDKLTRWTKPYFEEDETCKSCFFVPVCQGCSCPVPRIKSGERPCPPEKLEIRNTLVSIYQAKVPVASYDVTRGERQKLPCS